MKPVVQPKSRFGVQDIAPEVRQEQIEELQQLKESVIESEKAITEKNLKLAQAYEKELAEAKSKQPALGD